MRLVYSAEGPPSKAQGEGQRVVALHSMCDMRGAAVPCQALLPVWGSSKHAALQGAVLPPEPPISSAGCS